MLLFDQNTCADVCLLNENPYVRLAAEDLIADFRRVSKSGIAPRITKEITARAIVIEENTLPVGYEPCEHESFSVRVEIDRAKEILSRGEGGILQTAGLCGLLLLLYFGFAALLTWILPMLF